MFNNRLTKVVIGILAVSVILRVGSAIYLGNKVDILPGTYDQVSYHNLAIRLLEGHGFSFSVPWWPLTAAGTPTAHWSFLYTFYLALIYAVFGPDPIAARIIQAVIVGLLQPILVYLIGKRVFNPSVGLLAAGLTAIYTYFIYYAGTLMTEPFYITAILASIYLAIEFTREDGHHGWAVAIGLGIVLSIAVLLRQLFLLLVPFLGLWIWWSARRIKIDQLILKIFVACAIIFLVIAPFTIYNYQRFHRFVLLNTNAGFAFFWGNHPIYGTHFVPILTSDMGTYQDLVPKELRGLDEAALDQALLKRGIQFILDDPGRYILLSLSRIPPYFMFWPSSDSSMVSNISRIASFGLVLPFMIYGLVLAVSKLPRNFGKAIESPVILLIGFSGIYALIHLLSWVLIRYRLPIDAVLILFASLAVIEIYERIEYHWKMVNHVRVSRQ